MTEKEQLIVDIKNILMNNIIDYKGEIISLLNSALEKKTIRELKDLEQDL